MKQRWIEFTLALNIVALIYAVLIAIPYVRASWILNHEPYIYLFHWPEGRYGKHAFWEAKTNEKDDQRLLAHGDSWAEALVNAKDEKYSNLTSPLLDSRLVRPKNRN